MVKRKKVFSPSLLSALSLWEFKHNYIHTMDNPTQLHKLTVLSQLLVELHIQTLETQTRVIKAAGEEDLRTMLLNRYPLRLKRLNEMPKTMTALIKAVKELNAKNNDSSHKGG